MDRIIEREGETQPALYNRGLALSIAGDVAGASRDFEAILDQDPDDVDTLNAYGYLLADQRIDMRRAEEMISAAYAAEPGSAPIIDSMGWLRYRQGRLEEAVTLLTDAWIVGEDPEIGAHLGEVLWEMGERVRARSIWETAALASPYNPVLLETIQRLDPEAGSGG